jgi:hypothetical protein
MSDTILITAVRVSSDCYNVTYFGEDGTRYSERANWNNTVAIARKVDADEIHVDRRRYHGEGESLCEVVPSPGFVQTFK